MRPKVSVIHTRFLATLLMGADGLTITPQVVVAVVVSFVVTAVLPTPAPSPSADAD